MVEKLVPKLRFSGFYDNWKEVKIKDISKSITKGTTPKKYSDEGINFIKVESIINNKITKIDAFIDEDTHNNELNRSILKKNDLLFSIAGSLGRTTIITEDVLPANTNQALSIIRFEENNDLNLNFIESRLNTYDIAKYIFQNLAVGAQPNLNLQQVGNISIKIPSHVEQDKIQKFFDYVDKKIELLKKKHESYQNFKKYLMQQIFTQKLRFENFDNNWEFKKLGQVSIVKDGTHDSPKYISNGYPLITSKNLLNGEIDFENVNYISKEDYDNINKRSNVDKGDLLFGMIGTIGNPLIVETDEFAIKNVALIKEKEDLLNSFLIHVLETDLINKQFYRLNAGGTQKFIALGLIKDLLVPIPSIEEQLKISEFLSVVDKNLNSYKNQISNINKFKKGLLQQMFI